MQTYHDSGPEILNYVATLVNRTGPKVEELWRAGAEGQFIQGFFVRNFIHDEQYIAKISFFVKEWDVWEVA